MIGPDDPPIPMAAGLPRAGVDFEALHAALPAGSAVPDAAALRALLTGVAAAPPDRYDAWTALVAADLPQDLGARLGDAVEALRPPGLQADPGRLPQLRAELRRRGLHGFVVPRADEHQGEYVPTQAERLAWLTGFTGSAGLAVVTEDRAVLFVDGRYTLQAEAQARPQGFEISHQGSTPFDRWLAESLGARQRLGFDPWLHTVSWLEKTRKGCEDIGAELVAVSDNPIDALWRDRPIAPLGAVVPHPLEYAGEAAVHKRARIAELLLAEGDGAAVLTAPDAIAWLLNLRGGDVPHTPLPLGFAVIEASGRVDLFLDQRKLTPAVRDTLDHAVSVNPPDQLGHRLDALGRQGLRVRLDPNVANAWVLDRLHRAGVAIRRADDVCALPKACKNDAELAGARACHRRDAVALCRFLHWLSVEGPKGTLTELDVIAQIERMRARSAMFRDVSFDTIAGFGPHAAVVHYRAEPATNRTIRPDGLLLVDSGGQYLDGTTDITRTIAIGTPTPAMRRHFTLVLKGHIAVAMTRFPDGTTGSQIDPLARQFLWRDGLDFDHGTGHGVGSYLSVHEGPQRLSKTATSAVLRPGMIVSNEPGFYADGAYGIRIENLLVVRAATDLPAGARPSLEFETLSFAPIDRGLIDRALLTTDEIAWLNAYHARVRETVMPQLDPAADAAAIPWLDAVTAPLDPSG